ncbi:hypothetical protein [Schleiferilactobacillus harbinensis]|uniref:hypothetical protein n=1 Tax=Schleiferilactobacillus harbinensis TaxID=304207 RepID=UPI0007BA5DBA|nr:hypothetical protein [Schleiferilactobacillus harbinensis]
MDNYPNLKQLLNTSFRIRHLDFSDANIEFHFIDMTPYPEFHQPNTWIILIPCHSAASVDINRFIMAQTTVLDVFGQFGVHFNTSPGFTTPPGGQQETFDEMQFSVAETEMARLDGAIKHFFKGEKE